MFWFQPGGHESGRSQAGTAESPAGPRLEPWLVYFYISQKSDSQGEVGQVEELTSFICCLVKGMMLDSTSFTLQKPPVHTNMYFSMMTKLYT